MAAVEEPSAKRQKVEEEPEKAVEDVSNGKEEVSKYQVVFYVFFVLLVLT